MQNVDYLIMYNTKKLHLPMNPHYKAMYKADLAAAAGVSSQTFRRWCRQHEAELEALRCPRKCKILNPAAVKYLCRIYSIEL